MSLKAIHFGTIDSSWVSLYRQLIITLALSSTHGSDILPRTTFAVFRLKFGVFPFKHLQQICDVGVCREQRLISHGIIFGIPTSVTTIPQRQGRADDLRRNSPVSTQNDRVWASDWKVDVLNQIVSRSSVTY